MKRLVLVNENEVQVDAPEPGVVASLEPGVYSVLWNGKSMEVWIAAERNGYTLDIGGVRFHAEISNPRNYTRQSKAAIGAGLQSIKASMAGKVIRVLVSPGQNVEAGAGMIVIEAMKMQNEMKAIKPGRVQQVHVKDGDTVTAGDVLITIE